MMCSWSVTEEPTIREKGLSYPWLFIVISYKAFFIWFWEEMQFKLRTTVALTFANLPQNVISFLCSPGLWLGWRKWFVWRGRCRKRGTVSVSKKPWFQDKLWGTLAHWIWLRHLSKYFINFWFHSHTRVFQASLPVKGFSTQKWKRVRSSNTFKNV